jgi:hypothetical protein
VTSSHWPVSIHSPATSSFFSAIVTATKASLEP